jgi:hypothetical protein
VRDTEFRFSARVFFDHVDILDSGKRWPFVHPLRHGIDGCRVTFERRLDSPIGRVSHEPAEPEPPSPLRAFGPKEHPLDLTGDEDVNSPAVCQLWHWGQK